MSFTWIMLWWNCTCILMVWHSSCSLIAGVKCNTCQTAGRWTGDTTCHCTPSPWSCCSPVHTPGSSPLELITNESEDTQHSNWTISHCITDYSQWVAVTYSSCFRVSSPNCPMHTAIDHMIKVLEEQILACYMPSEFMWDFVIPIL